MDIGKPRPRSPDARMVSFRKRKALCKRETARLDRRHRRRCVLAKPLVRSPRPPVRFARLHGASRRRRQREPQYDA
jgi:hypothetical protein